MSQTGQIRVAGLERLVWRAKQLNDLVQLVNLPVALQQRAVQQQLARHPGGRLPENLWPLLPSILKN